MSNHQKYKPIFELQDVWFSYAGLQPIEALHQINLQVYPGEYIAVIGSNGSGKSTLARLLNALLLPTRGSVLVEGVPTNDTTRRRDIRRTTQMVFQRPDFQIVATTVEEDVAFGPENFGMPEDELVTAVRSALETVGMWEQRSRPPHMLSAGQKQRVAIAGALAVNPRALILDEATSMLDPAGRIAVLAILRQLHQRGTTIITITHEMDEAAEASRVIVLHEGEVALDGTPKAVFAQARQLHRLALDVPLLADLALRLGLPVCLMVEELLAALGPLPSDRTFDDDISDSQPIPTHRSIGRIDPIIKVQGLYHTYLRGTPLATEALRGVDVEIGRGTITGLIGRTGSGKSTLMQHLNGLMRPQAGHVFVDGEDWADPALNVKIARQKVGLLFQQPEDQLFERYVGDDVAFGPRQMRLDRASVHQQVQAAMNAVGLPFEVFKDRLTQSLSGGEQRRAALAGVLALQPQILVTDEPTAGLDPRGRAQILEIFRQLNQDGATMLIGSHRLEDIAALCDRVIVLKDGRVAAEGPVREVLSHPKKIGQDGVPVLPLAKLVSNLRAAGWPVPSNAISVIEVAKALGASLQQRKRDSEAH
jgi:energy-coupling factor transport system ATP-binding protein